MDSRRFVASVSRARRTTYMGRNLSCPKPMTLATEAEPYGEITNYFSAFLCCYRKKLILQPLGLEVKESCPRSHHFSHFTLQIYSCRWFLCKSGLQIELRRRLPERVSTQGKICYTETQKSLQHWISNDLKEDRPSWDLKSQNSSLHLLPSI